MNRALFLLLFFLSCLMATATKVEPDQARKAGMTFYTGQKARINHFQTESPSLRGSFTEQLEGEVAYYVFVFDDGGWIAVSAEDAVTPVLAYAFSGGYSREDQPPQFITWMEGYSRQILEARQKGLTPSDEVAGEWERLLSSDPGAFNPVPDSRDVSPMLTSTWNQGSPYNFLCPADPSGPGGHVYSGCVATAMAQVMYYYRWPVNGTGQHCYNPSGYPQQCADFAATPYKWDEMLNSTTLKDTAMCLLQWHCGIGVNMMYGAGGSGAYREDAAAAMRNYFKYHPNTELVYKSDYSESEWASLLSENLDAGRPMYYHGFGSGGHAFNVDGYQGSDYFHFNWGWGGSYNGYYYLTNLNPGGSNFTEGQGAIVNIYPDTPSYTYPAYCTGQSELTALRGTIDDGSCPMNYQNDANCSWLISPQSNYDSIVSITISFQRFKTEAGADLVTIYKGSSPLGELVGQFSGMDIPAAVTVDGAEALITFTTNSATTLPGWFASYSAESMDWCQGMTILTEPQGSISDGSFGYDYKNNTLCRWKIVPEGTGAVELQFTSFHTASENDVLRIYDMDSEELLASYSGDYSGSNLPPTVTASSGKMFLIFSTDASDTKQGWEASYTTYAVGTKEESSAGKLLIFPNPASGTLNISLPDTKTQTVDLEVSSIQGLSLFHEAGQSVKQGGLIQLDISSLPSGMYLIRIALPEGSFTGKFMVE